MLLPRVLGGLESMAKGQSLGAEISGFTPRTQHTLVMLPAALLCSSVRWGQ